MRAALITGAICSAGAAIARDLAGHGWLVLLHNHRNSDADAVAALCRDINDYGGGAAHTLQADFTAPEAAADLIERAFEAAAGLELLINTASAFHRDTAQTATHAALVECFSMNSAVPLVLSQAFARLLPPGRNGAIVNVLDGPVFSLDPGYISRSVSQHAALAAIRMLALALAPRVRVNGVASNFASSSVCAPGSIAAAVRLIADSPAMTGTVIPVGGGPALAGPDLGLALTSAGAP